MPTSALFPVSPDCLFCGNTATVSPTACFFCCARKSRQKDALGDAPYCALTRDFLAAPRPERPLRAQNCYFPDSFRFRQMYYTQLSINCINFGSAHFRNTRPAATITAPCRAVRPYKDLQWNANISHHRRMRRWPVISAAACFTISMRGNDSRWERCLHAGGAVV